MSTNPPVIEPNEIEKILQNLDQLPDVPNDEKKRNLEAALYQFNIKYPFFAAFLSEIGIENTDRIPTACLAYNKKKNEFSVAVNPKFMAALPTEVRLGVLYHEVLHFTHGHLLRSDLMMKDPETMTPEEQVEFKNKAQLENIAADMAINCYIPQIPGPPFIKAENYKDDNGTPFPKYLTFEQYLELLKKHGENKHNKGKTGQKYKLVDEHDWAQMSDEEKARMLEKAKEVVTRTIEKTSNSFSNGKEQLAGLINQIETEINKLNYKQLLKLAIKQTICKNNREGTWTKPNRRYGVYAPGTREGRVPSLSVYVDTSGSISHTEMNKFLKVIKNFLKVGASSANIYLWHDSLYFSGKIKQSTTMESLPTEGGGTQIKDVIAHINKTKPDLAIVLTDGYFEKASMLANHKTIFVISEEGGKNHPYKDSAKTVLLSGVV